MSELQSDEFRNLLYEHCDFLEPQQLELAVRFREEVVKENAKQNLTRLTSPEDFFSGHIQDVVSLWDSGFLSLPALDFGSGPGVPGLLYSILFGGSWVLAESEKNKANFLKQVITNLNQKEVMIYEGRAEKFLKEGAAQSVVVRAVGTVDRVAKLIRKCSTWNKLILFKGKGWKDEYTPEMAKRLSKIIKHEGNHEYEVGISEKKYRVIACFSRVQ